MSAITRKEAVETPTTNSEGPRQSTETETAMDVDELDPECSAATQKRPTTPEIRVVSLWVTNLSI
ncbi:hypothetical protein PGT21_029581 [Puccinia graminis f. sp. tritici]|uniref:Uncharacterized protein n=1 Tax=Puccinia graminis f. sp. tritici TaxID=56615 RepID=A0A5B0P6W9_PUCGR|nr:hypothetical protein PGT21_029581 [Puccinia graminis f. sp. tritici]